MEVKFEAGQLIRELEQKSADVEAVARQSVVNAAKIAVRAAKASTEFEDRTGKLRASIEAGERSKHWTYIRAKAKHALYIEEPTKPHAIVARKAKFLRFWVGDELVIRKRVFHPGLKVGKFFMCDAGREAEEKIFPKLEAALERILSK